MEQKNSRKRLNSLILLVAFTAIMLIVSTYAWFSTQKNVTLGGLTGKVNVAEGLQISLDAKTWKNEIDFSTFTTAADGTMTSDVYLPGATFQQPYVLTYDTDGTTPLTYAENIIPDELLPVSTTGTETIKGFNSQAGDEIIYMYWGDNVDQDDLKAGTVKKMDEEVASGYFAFDFFLQNSSKAGGAAVDLLQLEQNSDLNLMSSDKETTGLQNTVRVAVAVYENSNDDKVIVNSTPEVKEIIQGTAGQKIKDVAIWEPNADAHVQYIVDSNNDITWNADDAVAVFGTGTAAGKKAFAVDTQMPTYALTATSVTKAASANIADIYDWSTTGVAAGGLQKQYTLQTPSTGVAATTQLVSAKDGTTEFSITPGQYHKCRMYIWLEGQDVDCINYASLGGGIDLDFGFSKPGNS